MRLVVSALSLSILMAGCGLSAPLSVPSSATVVTQQHAASVTAPKSTWQIQSLTYGGGDSEGIIDIDAIDYDGAQDPEYKLVLTFTDLNNSFAKAPFRALTINGKQVTPGSAPWNHIVTNLNAADTPLGVDVRILTGALQVLANAKSRS